MSFSAQNQLDQTDNSMSWIIKQGVVEYNVHWGWKCSDKGDKSFVWLEQKQVKETNEEQTLNVSRGNCLQKKKEIMYSILDFLEKKTKKASKFNIIDVK